MGKNSDDNKDYEEYKVKVPKYDKEGNDITGEMARFLLWHMIFSH